MLLLLAACSRAESGSAAPGASDSAPASLGVPVAYRLPARGGTVQIYRLPSLEAVKWNAGNVTAPRTAVGLDLVGRRLLFRDSSGMLVSYDLVASRERVIAPRGSLAALGTDGTLFAVDTTGAVIESQPWGTRSWTGSLGRGVSAAFATPGARLIVIRRAGGDSLAIASRETGISASQAVPTAISRAATRDGDAVAFATDSGVHVLDEGARDDTAWFVRLPARPTAVAFSPSGHRLYLALQGKSELAVVDRFARRLRQTIALPEPATALRMDPWGRVLLVKGPGAGDTATAWVVSLAEGRVSDELATAWRSDLPAVSEEGVLLLREGGAVVARDVRTLDSLGALPGGGADLWFAGRGSPRGPPAWLSRPRGAAGLRGEWPVGWRAPRGFWASLLLQVPETLLAPERPSSSAVHTA